MVDGLVQTLVNTGSIKEDDFHKESNGTFLLNREAFRRFLTAYEERMEKVFLDRNENFNTSYRKLFQRQVVKMEQVILNREEYQPFPNRQYFPHL